MQVDYKARAAGDENHQQHDLFEKHVRMALIQLLTFTRAEVSPDEQKMFEARLRTIPLWKLQRLNEFTSPFINEVWKFFDQLQFNEVEKLVALPEPDRSEQQVSLARDFDAHVKKVLGWNGDSDSRIKFEIESLKALDKKYPELGVWRKLRHEKRFQKYLPSSDFS